MLIKNWSLANGLCNGTRLQVTACNMHTVSAVILFGSHAGIEHTFSRTNFTPGQNSKIWFSRFQFPFRLSFAMTINKSQGQTFERVGIWLKKPVFTHGQLYTAESRGRGFDRVKIKIDQIDNGNSRQGRIPGYDGVYTKNIVDKSVLL